LALNLVSARDQDITIISRRDGADACVVFAFALHFSNIDDYSAMPVLPAWLVGLCLRCPQFVGMCPHFVALMPHVIRNGLLWTQLPALPTVVLSLPALFKHPNPAATQTKKVLCRLFSPMRARKRLAGNKKLSGGVEKHFTSLFWHFSPCGLCIVAITLKSPEATMAGL
jgi:hypothetical protein